MSDAAGEAVEHLQKAAVEMIRATRAFLDLAEELIEDPGPLLDLVNTFAAKGRHATQPEEGPKVQRIRVS